MRTRTFVICLLMACTGSAPSRIARPEPAPPSGASLPVAGPRALPAVATGSVRTRIDVDPIAVLTPPDDGVPIARLAPGAAQLELGATPIESPGPASPLDVTVFDEQGQRVRVAIRLDHARFAIWTDRARLFATLVRDERVRATPGDVEPLHGKQVVLQAGASVKRLARRSGWTQVRYEGALEVQGWVPDAVLADSATPHSAGRRFPSGRHILNVVPGTVVRDQPSWTATALAVMANGYFVDTVQRVDDAWIEISYQDGDLTVTGYVSRRDPPGAVHGRRPDLALAPVPITPTTKVASGTCLLARIGGDPLGYLVGDQEVELTGAGPAWWNLAIDTPWGPIVFVARGPDASTLQTCAPPRAASALIAPVP